MRALSGLRGKAREPATSAGEADGRRILIAVCSAKHSPGVTTLALALAASPPAAGSLLVEADPVGGDLAVRLGGRARVGLSGLLGKAHRGLTAEAISEQCQWLAVGPALLAAPVDHSEATSCVAALAARLADLVPQVSRRSVCDCGRITPGSPAMALARAADVVVWLMNDDKAGLEHTRARLQSTPELLQRSVAVLGGRSTRECDPTELQLRLEIPVLGRVRLDVDGVDLLLSGSRRWERTNFGTDVSRLLEDLRLFAEAATAPQDTWK